MRINLDVSIVYFDLIVLAGSCLAATYSCAGALNGMNDPDRIKGKFIVVLKRERIAALKSSVLSKGASKSEDWQMAKAAADAEVAQIVDKLKEAHPAVRISAVMSHGKAPGFVLRASDEDAKAIANEEEVAEVDADSAIDSMKNVHQTF